VAPEGLRRQRCGFDEKHWVAGGSELWSFGVGSAPRGRHCDVAPTFPYARRPPLAQSVRSPCGDFGPCGPHCDVALPSWHAGHPPTLKASALRVGIDAARAPLRCRPYVAACRFALAADIFVSWTWSRFVRRPIRVALPPWRCTALSWRHSRPENEDPTNLRLSFQPHANRSDLRYPHPQPVS
jgi:hypothetical protein